MKKIILALIILITSTSLLADSSNGQNFLKKPTVNTSTLSNIKGPIIPIIDGKCELMCEYEFRSCTFQGGPWHACNQQYAECLFGVDGCFGI
jgi:hypothetical protein